MIRARLAFVFFAIAVALCLSATAHAANFEAFLDGLQETPPNASPAFGSATLSLDGLQNSLTINLDFSDLLGGTTAGHIHAPAAPGVPAGVAIGFSTDYPFGVTSGTYSMTFDLTDSATYLAGYVTANGGTAASARAAFLAALSAELTYINVHSSVFPGGEIRGQIVSVVPEPASMSLLALAAPALLLRRRR